MLLSLLFAAACGSSSDDEPRAATTTVGADSSADASTSSTADESSDQTADVAATEPPVAGDSGDTSGGAGTDDEPSDGSTGATLAIGDQTWSFTRVNLCSESPPEDESVAFLLLIVEDDLQLSLRITDPTGERRTEGDGVVNTIDFFNTADPTLDLWQASSQSAGNLFVVRDGSTVTAETNFVDLRTDDTVGLPGRLDASCP